VVSRVVFRETGPQTLFLELEPAWSPYEGADPATLSLATAGLGDERQARGERSCSRAEAVVTVQLVVKRRYVVQGREQGSADQKIEIAGTTLQADGLTVISDFTSNPAGLFSSEDREGAPKVDTDTTDVKIVLKDGREIPSRFVLRTGT
jgi:hypothetical protein